MKKLILLSLFFQLSNLIAQPNGVDIAYGSDPSHKLDYSIATNSNSPIMIIVHGGGWATGDKAGYVNVANFFKTAGYAVVNINYRLSGDAGFPGHPAIPQDVACAIGWTKVNAGLINGDSSRVIMYGHSAGAHLCMLHGLTHPQSLLSGCGYNAGLKISGVISANAPVNFEYINPLRYADIKPMVVDSINYWDDAAPANNLSNGNNTKFMIIVGQSDGFLGTQQSLVFNDSMSTYDYCKRFYFLPGTHTSFLNVSEPIFNDMLDFADSLWAGQLCPSVIGISENEKNIRLKIYPNPTSNTLYFKSEQIDFEKSNVEIINYLGQTVLKTEFINQIDVSGLVSGFYTLMLKDNSGSFITKKFVKE